VVWGRVKTKPIQSQFKPNQTQFKANFDPKQSQTKPILMVKKLALFGSTG
jgi:hypothetical protein